MNSETLHSNLVGAQSFATLQPSGSHQYRNTELPMLSDPGSSKRNTISQEDLVVFKNRCPHLCEFSDQFLRERTIDELLRLESTSIRIKDAERSRESEDRLAGNKAALATKFYNVPAGRDNRCSELHPARFLPGAACSAARQFITARDVIGLANPPPTKLL